MDIQMIAVDMDGTFLNDQKKYDQKRFLEQYAQMKTQGIHFVVASGNQYYQLRSFFPEIHEELAFVAENGAFVLDQMEPLFVGEMSEKVLKRTLEVLAGFPAVNVILCGENSAYVTEDTSMEFYQYASRYNHRLQRVPKFDNLYEQDTLFKFALNFPKAEFEEGMIVLEKELFGSLNLASSGHGDVDLILPGIHKASGLQRLQKRWGIPNEATAAFGDGGNDIEMLQHVALGFAMENASDTVKKMTSLHIGNNNQSAVLDTIDQILLGNY